MKLAMVAGLAGPRPAVVIEQEILELEAGVVLGLTRPSWHPPSVRALLDEGPGALAVALGLSEAVAVAPPDARERLRLGGWLRPLDSALLLPPLGEPRLILCSGYNYPCHLREVDVPTPQRPRALQRAQSCVTGPGQPIVLPPEAPSMVDYEGELAVVIGRPAHRIAPAEALAHVAGYMCANDVSARDFTAARLAVMRGLPPPPDREGRDVRSWDHLWKQFPTFLPLGPWLVTADELPDPDHLRLRTWVNGELRQDASTADMVFHTAEFVAHFSRFYALRPGDVLTLGSPGGCGYTRVPPRFLRSGDEVAVEIEGIGRLSNRVLSAE